MKTPNPKANSQTDSEVTPRKKPMSIPATAHGMGESIMRITVSILLP